MTLPEEFVKMINEQEEIDAGSFLEAMNREPHVAVRVNRKKIDSLNLGYEDIKPVSWCEDGFYLDKRPVFTLNPLLHGGAFYVQDASSMVHSAIIRELSEKLRGSDNRTLLVADLCAAPGGKTTAIISALNDNDIVIANEFDPKRVKILEENLLKWGHPNVAVYNRKVSDLADKDVQFDIVVVDAPCSGEGMMRKDADAVSQWSRKLVESCASLQKEILADACRMVKAGGFLVYSTCTFNKTENEEQLKYLKDVKGFIPVEISCEELRDIPAGFDKEIPSMRFMPHITEGEGLFVGVMKRPEGEDVCSQSSLPISMKKTVKKEKSQKIDQVDVTRMKSWISEDSPTQFEIVLKDKECFAVSNSLKDVTERLGTYRMLYAGVPLAELKGKEYMPNAMLPFCSKLNRNAFCVVELSEEDAISYLRRNALKLTDDVPKGYVVVSYKGVALGFVKNLGSRANNLYPQNWRIRM